MSDWRQDYEKFKKKSDIVIMINKKYDENSGMRGKLGRALKMRFTPQYCKDNYGIDISVGEYTEKEIEALAGGFSFFYIPVEVAYDVEGEYECVCENGIEIY
jgi:uncharacterized protein (UPF0332 family)